MLPPGSTSFSPPLSEAVSSFSEPLNFSCDLTPAPLFFWLPTLWGGRLWCCSDLSGRARGSAFGGAGDVGGTIRFHSERMDGLMPLLIVTLWVRAAMAAETPQKP